MEFTVGTRAPNSKGKWHIIAYDNTYCSKWVNGDWVTKPLSEILETDVCGTCRNCAGLPAPTPSKECAEPGCTAWFTDHRWGATKAHKDGWFHQKDGNSWCPEHVPDWVERWRRTRESQW